MCYIGTSTLNILKRPGMKLPKPTKKSLLIAVITVIIVAGAAAAVILLTGNSDSGKKSASSPTAKSTAAKPKGISPTEIINNPNKYNNKDVTLSGGLYLIESTYYLGGSERDNAKNIKLDFRANNIDVSKIKPDSVYSQPVTADQVPSSGTVVDGNRTKTAVIKKSFTVKGKVVQFYTDQPPYLAVITIE
jgi:hypothetical protein